MNGFILGGLVVALVVFIYRALTQGYTTTTSFDAGMVWALGACFIYGHWIGAL